METTHKMNFHKYLLLLGVGTLAVSAEPIERINVTGYALEKPLSQRIQASKVELSGDELNNRKADTLGETLSQLPGVDSGFFGSSSGRPQIRGFGGNRVKMLLNGTQVEDMSSVSEDQYIPIEPFLADSILVIKGPTAVIAYGGQAMAGIVDLQDGRIPLSPINGFNSRAEVKAGFNSTSTALAKLTAGNESFNFALNMINKDRGDYDIPGYSKDSDCKTWSKVVGAAQFADLCQIKYAQPVWQMNNQLKRYEDATPLEQQIITDYSIDSNGTVLNSSHHTSSFSAGGSYTGQQRLLGLAYGYTDTHRGIPGFMRRGSSAPVDFDQRGNIRIFSRGDRVDMKYVENWDDNWINSFSLDGAYSNQVDDEHMAEVSVNQFELTSWVISPKLYHSWTSNFDGVLGLQYDTKAYKGEGYDNYMPDVDSQNYAAYTLQTLHFGPVTFEFGGRYDAIKHQVNAEGYKVGRGSGANVKDRNFYLQSYSGSLQWDILQNWSTRVNYVHAERAPEMSELYASNPHYALLIEEQGSSNLKKEINHSFEINTTAKIADLQLMASWYQNQFNDFIYLGSTGLERNGTYVREWRQADTNNQGLEVQAIYTLPWQRWGVFELSAFTDRVRNTPRYQYDGSYDIFSTRPPLAGERDEYFRRRLEGTSMPRTPQSKTGTALNWQYDALTVSIDYVRYHSQGDVSRFERPSESYALLGANITLDQVISKVPTQFYLSLDNLTDVDARPHNSFLRHLSPMPGRSAAIGVRVQF